MTRTIIHTVPLTAATPPTSHSKPPSIMVRDSGIKASLNLSIPCTLMSPRSGFERPSTPNSDEESSRNEPPEFVSKPRDLSDDEEDYVQHRRPQKKQGYDSRVEQILCENEDLQIIITEAGKSHESGGSYIAYTIRTGVGGSLT